MNTNKQGFSIIMTVYDQAHELKENLTAFLTQVYEPGYEVIVVDETSTDDTPDVLKLYKQDYPNLYTTFLPKQSRSFVRRKMAFNIGLKASKNEWVILQNINNEISGENELQAIAEALDEDAELTFAYISKKGIRLQPFASYEDARYHLLKAERKLKHVHNRRFLNYTWGRYNFIIVRKDVSYDVLKYFGQKFSATSLLGYRMRILFKNLFGRSKTTFIKFE
jgi:glycosyltransferase involved in cell wall biosynthesis